MFRRPPNSTRTYSLLPYPSLCRSDQSEYEGHVRGEGEGSVHYGRDWGFGIGDAEKCASGSGNMPSPTPVRRILATTREIGMAMLFRIQIGRASCRESVCKYV